ncbi:sushi, von Willebrand factor type A, EGF and pentraxin domain-containing protein 1-like [Physella acuta]|uniref:sushi, von Willebrand factor type A, EGF and pentraxin domain-containing protein 1-like n=1 Tax=Physella acuta TaxID=109671 RepID=UPI0027DD827C|nr:sushi, von Willebrand factor type A, EGF and pentraxin domain-containing protein 1-like [Physella acuta]
MWARVFFLSVCLLELTALVSCNFTLEFSCPEGWTLFPNGTYCYYYSRVELDYGAAVDVCDKYGAALLEVRDEREAKVVAQKANETFGQSQKYFWISAGQEYNTAEDFVIANATKCKGFWEVGQPASDDVNMAIASNMAGRWTLKPLGDRLRFVCRAPACPQDSFRCRDGTCLNVKWKCDQAMDCSDGTDEADCRDCVKHINASSDQIVDFTRKDNCQWTIEGQPGEVLKIEFTAIHIQAGVDTLLIYSGGPSIKTSQLVGQIRSNDMPKTVFGVNHFLIVVFRSTDVASGFAAKWEPDDELSKTVQTIRVTSTPWEFNSPHHNSSNLPLSYRKTWSLEAKEGETILLEIHNSSFDLANKSSISITNVGFSLCDPSTGRAFFISSSPSMVISVQTNTAQYLHAVVNTGCNFSMELTQARFELLNLSKNIVCEWTIKNRQPTNFSLNMQDIQFLGQDSLQLYDGKVGGAPVVTVNGSTGNKVSHLGLSSTVVMVYRSYGLTSGSKLLGAVSADCSDLNSPNLEVSPQGREGGESYKVSITCATGYTFVQEEYNSNSTLEAECKLGGNWYWGSNSLTRLPTCQVVYCGVPSPIDNGKLTYISANVSLGAKATYECYGGFNLSGSDTVECLSNGSWSTPPTCEAKLCPELTDVENIGNTEEIRNANRSFGTVIKFECSPGFDLLGSQQIVCLANGSWNHVVPSCRKLTCPLLPVENGAYNTSLPVEFLAGASLQCHPGYWVERTNTPEVIHSCTANRTLSQNDTCVDIDECLNETHNCNTTTQTCENTIGFYTCNCKDGYQLEQSSYTCTDIDECEENTSYCGQHCHNLVGSYKCSCDPDGFELYTQNGTNGYFLPQAEDGSEPDHKYHINHTCVYTVCDNTPDQPLNGTFLTKRSRFVYNETVAVACEFGFKIEGPSSVRCLGNNSWTQVPTCKEMYCDDIPPKSDLEAGRIPDGKTRLEPGEELVIICRTKHSSETVNKTLFCAPNRTGAFELQGDNPTCPEVDCGEVWNIPGAVVDRPANTTYGSQFEFKCNSEKGFKLRGNSSLGNTTVECQSNGIWGYNSLTCIGHSCGDPGTKAGTRQIVNTSYEVDQVVTYECEQTNYTAERTHLICEFHNGTAKWSGEAPLCVDTQKPTITCPKDKSLSLYETITYDPPKVTDNSVHSCYMLKSGPPSGVAVISNDTTIKFQAYDPHNFSQSVDCEFTIYLKAISRPEIICPVSHDVVLTENLPKTITFNESFIVSSTPNTTLTFTPPSLEVTAGNVYAIRARVQGDNPFYKECAFLLNVTTVSCYKDVIKAPGNGSINCTGNNSTMTCTAACNADFLFQDKTQAQNFTCTNGMWSQASSMDCLELKNTLVGYDISVTYNTTTQMLAGFDNQCFFEHHTILLNNIKLSEICGASRTLATNLKSSRSTLMSITTTLTLKLFTNANATWLEQCIKDTLNSEVFGPTSPMVTGKDCSTPWTVGNSEAPKNLGISCDDKSYEIRFQNESFCLPCGAGMNFSSTCQTCPDGTYQDEDGQTACKPCPDGIKHSSLPRTHVENCIALCPSGFNSSTGYVKDGCTACPTDTYSSPDRLSCTPCPNGGSTVGVSGAVNKSFCFDPCLPGEYSVTGYQPCNECPLHFYTDHNKSLQCEECPEDTYTDKPGSTSLTDCSKKVDQLCTANYCHAAGSNGTCLIKDHRPVCTCNEGYHGDRCNETCDICHTKPCYNNGTCVTKGSDYTCSCPYNEICKFELATNLGIQTGDEVIIQTGVMTQRDCEANCLENKECLAYYFQRPTCLIYLTLVVVVDGIANVYKKNCTQVNLFGGKQCEHDIDIQCKADTCTQPEYCQEMVDGFKCICPAGQDYNETCAIPTDFCSPNPCLNGNCTTFDSVRYECTCPPGYTGKNCEKNIDECKVNPKGCLYNGTCDDNIDEYSCSCAPGFKGSHCEVRHDMCQDITCVEGDGDKCTNDYHSLTASCTCREHYSLSSTGKCEPINYCSSSPCSNGGTCQNFTGGFNCSCPPDFIGATCQFQWKNETETDVCSDLVKCTDRMKEFFCDCQNESAPCTSNYSACIEKCQSSNNLQDILICNCFCRNATLQKVSETLLIALQIIVYIYKCTFEKIYLFQGPVDICTMEKPCLHGGNCSHDNETYTCACPLGWTGRDCEVAVDYCNQSNPCHNNGSCINLWDQSFCRCLPGTGGDTCENATDLCHKFNDSLCVDGTCQSTNGSAQCDCSEGSAGQSCELEKNWCNLDLGLCTHGTCVLNNTQFYCDCASGQSGVEGGCVADLCSTCLDPSNCHVYVDASGVPTPGCMCPPDQVAVGKECKVVNGDFDLGFTKELAEKKKYVTSQNGFTIPPNSDLTVSFWFLQIKDVPVDGFMLALMKYNKLR